MKLEMEHHVEIEGQVDNSSVNSTDKDCKMKKFDREKWKSIAEENLYHDHQAHPDKEFITKEFDKLEKFLTESYSIVSPSFEAYITGVRPVNRLSIMLLIKFFGGFLTSVRCITSMAVDTPLVRSVMSEANHLMGNRYIISLIMTSGGLGMCLWVGGYTLVMDMKMKLIAIEYLIRMREQLTKGAIHGKYRANFIKHLRFTTKYISWPLVLFLMTNATMVFSLPPIVAYFQPNSIYNIPSIIFWTICTIVLCYDFYTSLFTMFILMYLSSTYLRYQFKQVHDKIREAVSKSDKTTVMKCMSEHHDTCISTVKLNSVFKDYIAILFIICKPGLNSLLYTSLSPESNIISTFTTTAMFLITTILIMSINIICSSISSMSHKPAPYLYALLTKPNLNLSLNSNLKIKKFIDKLTGPKIGFYCFDLYPMTSYEFYRDILSFTSFYILMNTFISEFKNK